MRHHAARRQAKTKARERRVQRTFFAREEEKKVRCIGPRISYCSCGLVLVSNQIQAGEFKYRVSVAIHLVSCVTRPKLAKLLAHRPKDLFEGSDKTEKVDFTRQEEDEEDAEGKN